MNKIKTLASALVLAGLSAFGATTPTSEKNAIELKPSSTAVKTAAVTLYKEADDRPYVCYYKMTLKKGQAYTVWLEGMSDASVKIRAAYPEEDFSKLPPIAEFEKTPCGDEVRYIVSGKEWAMDVGDFDWDDDWGDDWGDDWDDDWGGEDLDWGKTPDSWTYYIVVEGNKDKTATLNYVMAKKLPVGIKENPLVIEPTTTETAKKLEFKGKEYFLKAKLKAGQRYCFGCYTGTKANQLKIAGLSKGTLATYAAWNATYNQAVQYVPDADYTCTFKVTSTAGLGATGKLKFKVDPMRKIADHPVKATLTAGKCVNCTPGYMNDPKSGFFDRIVDEYLYKFKAEAGKNYVVVATNAIKDIAIYLYDTKGNVIASNTSSGMGSKNVRVAIPAPSAKTLYYIGVCENQPLLKEKAPSYNNVKLMVREVAKTTGSTIVLAPAPYNKSEKPVKVDLNGSATATLGESLWYAKYKFNGRKGVTYIFQTKAVKSVTTSEKLSYKAYNNSSKKVAVEGTGGLGDTFRFTADANALYCIEIQPAAGRALDFYPFKLHSLGFISGKTCGSLTVNFEGAEGSWTIDSETVKYKSGETVILPVGKKTVKFTAVSGCTTPANRTVTISSNKQSQLNDNYYKDKWDPKDDAGKGATAWEVKDAKTYQKGHSLWKDDEKDYFSIVAKEGYYYTIKIYDHKSDQVFDVKREDGKMFAKGVSGTVKRLQLPVSDKKYFVIVRHANGEKGGTYNLMAYYEKVGVVRFAAESVTVKDMDTSVKLSVKRSGGTGALKVKYATANGTAKAEDQYVKQTGYIEWKDGETATKTVTITLIPKMLPIKGGNLDFALKLTDAADGKCLPASFPKGATSTKATVTIKNTATSKNAAAAYKTVYTDTTATVKEPEVAPLRGGTFYGVIRENGGALSRGAYEFAAITFTGTSGAKALEDKLSAKVKIADTTYTMALGDGERAWDGSLPEGGYYKTLRKVKRVAGSVCTNELKITVSSGKTKNYDWLDGFCRVELKMHFASADGKSVEVGTYSGELYRRNDKVEKYLVKAFLFDGYYTVSILPGQVLGTDGSEADAGVPAGNGYLTVAVSNKGKATIAGKLANNTAVSLSATACGIVRDENSFSKNLAMIIPVHVSDATSCLAGNIRLFMQEDKDHPDGKGYRIVADSSELMVWNIDKANLTYDAKQGWRMDLVPVGGWYDKLVNLQAYYNDHAKKFVGKTPDSGFPRELLESGYEYVTDAARMPRAASIGLVGDTFKVSGENPCKVNVTFTRATGVTSGSLILLAQDESGNEKSVGSFKHYGVLTIDRDDCDGGKKPLADSILDTGFMIKAIDVGGRTWKYSAPFSIKATSWK